MAAAEAPLTSSPMLAAGKPMRVLNHSRTCRSIQTAAWFPPATLGFMAAANASAKIPTGVGGEFTHA